MSIAEKLVTIAENVDKVYEAGKRAGGGGDSTDFWEYLQDSGNRTTYQYAFYRWDGSFFNPVRGMAPTGDYGADYMFAYTQNMGDLKTLFESKGITLDFSRVGRLTHTFNQCSASKLPDIDLSGCTRLAMSFYNMPNLTELTLTNLSPTCDFDRVFNYSHKLVTLNITGTIGQNGLTFANNYGISADSINKILTNNLQDKTGDTSGTKWKITLGSNKDKASKEALEAAEAKGWVVV